LETLAGNISMTSATPVIDATTGTLSINTVTNKPVTFGTGLVTLGGALTVTGLLTANNFASSSVAITGGTESGVAITTGSINNTPIGATTASTGKFTTVQATTSASSPLFNSIGATALSIDTGATSYAINIAPTNATSIVFGNATTNPTYSFNGTGASTFGGALTVTGNTQLNGTLSVNGNIGTTGGGNTITIGSGATTNKATLYLDNNYNSGAIQENNDSMIFYNANNSVERMRILYNGDVGITTTAPTQALTVGTSSTQANILDPYGWLCIGSSSNHCAGTYTAGTIYAASTTLTGADYAEAYLSTDLNMQPGMLVTSDSENTDDMVETTTTSYDPTLTGVISTAPGTLIGDTSTDNPIAGTKAYPIALTGRVPVLVTDENGPIKIGDYLTSSATMPGYAMKATHSGITIGQALASFDNTTSGALTQMINGETFHTGTLTLFVHVAYENINNTYVIGAEDMTIAQQIVKGLAQGTTDTQSLTASNNADSFIIKQNPRTGSGVGSGSGASGISSGAASMAAILQVQSGNLVRFMVAADGAETINAQPADPTENIFVVNNSGTAAFAITATGNVIVSQTLIVKKDIASLGEVLGTSAIVARNISTISLHQGDLVILKGAETQQIAGEQNPILSVVPSTAATPVDAAAQTIVGVVDRDLSDFNIPGAPVSVSTDITVIPVQEYMDIVTSGTYTKLNVDSSGGAIIAGDKLTVSANAGYARKMLPTEQGQMPLVGVALDSLASGSGQVRVYLMLNQGLVAAATMVASGSGSGSTTASISGGGSTPTTTTSSTATDGTTTTTDTTATTGTSTDASVTSTASTDSTATTTVSSTPDSTQSTISVVPSSSAQSDISVVAPVTTDSSSGVAAQSSVISGS
jgi:hypothetical protein